VGGEEEAVWRGALKMSLSYFELASASKSLPESGCFGILGHLKISSTVCCSDKSIVHFWFKNS
jgi:hypothetical protein